MTLVVLEEEGWIPFTWQDFTIRRLSPGVVRFIDEYWCSNRSQYEAVTCAYPRLVVRLTGHPRWNRTVGCTGHSRRIKNVLLVSTFGLLSSDVNFLDVMKKETGKYYNQAAYQEIHSQLLLKFSRWKTFVTEVIARFGDRYNFRLRLHPVERGAYDSAFLKNLVLSNLSLPDDLSRADLIIHPGSTVALDAEYSGVPSILFFDNTNILLASDPLKLGLMDCEIFDLLEAAPRTDALLRSSGSIAAFQYEFPVVDCEPTLRLETPTRILGVYNLSVRMLASLNYKAYRGLCAKLQRLAEVEDITRKNGVDRIC